MTFLGITKSCVQWSLLIAQKQQNATKNLPMPIVYVSSIRSFLNNPSWVTLSPFSHFSQKLWETLKNVNRNYTKDGQHCRRRARVTKYGQKERTEIIIYTLANFLECLRYSIHACRIDHTAPGNGTFIGACQSRKFLGMEIKFENQESAFVK